MIAIVGVGALGSHLALFLRNESEQIRLIDHDRVEHKNLTSQFHGKPQLGKSKVSSLSRTMDFLFGPQNYQQSGVKLVESNVDSLLGPHGPAASKLVVDCLDNAESRRLVQNHCRAHAIPCLHGALATNGQFGRVIWSKDFIIDSESSAGAPTCEDGDHLPFIALTAAYLARAAQQYLRDGKQVGYSISPGGAVCV